MPKVEWVRSPLGVFELRWRRKPILHTAKGRRTNHDYLTDEVRRLTHWPEDGWMYLTEEEARKAINEEILPPTQAEWDNAIGDGS